MNTDDLLLWALRFAGAGQLFTALMYFHVRNILGWAEDIARLRPHNRAIAGTYARYIQALNAAFGLLCLLLPRELLAGTPLAAALTLLIGLYWAGRIVAQYTLYDTTELTTASALNRLGERAFMALFALQALALLAAFVRNLRGLFAA